MFAQPVFTVGKTGELISGSPLQKQLNSGHWLGRLKLLHTLNIKCTRKHTKTAETTRPLQPSV